MLHKDSLVSDGIHIIHAWQVADAAALAALVPVAGDVGKVAYQVDTKQFWILKNSVGPVWAELSPTIISAVLTGLSTAAKTTVTAAHTILQAIGFLQAQNTANDKQFIPIAISDETTALTAGTGKVTFRMPFAMTVSEVRASLTTAQATDGAGGIFTVDINETGASIISTKLTIDNTEKTSTTAATPAVISDASLADDAEITIDIDQIGDGTAKGLKVYLIGKIT